MHFPYGEGTVPVEDTNNMLLLYYTIVVRLLFIATCRVKTSPS